MARINSKKKGGKNENVLAHAFQEWTGYEFARVPSSGGLRWKRTLDTTGDIMVADNEHIHKFPFSVETKFHESVDSWKLLRGQKSKLREFWEQAKADGVRGKKIPIVFFRYNGLPKSFWYVIIAYDLYRNIKDLMFFENGFFNYDNEFVIFPSTDLFETPYDILFKHFNRYKRNYVNSLGNNTDGKD